MKIIEKIQEESIWRIERFASEKDKKAKRVYSRDEALKLFGVEQISEFNGNLLLNEGINELFTLICSATGTKFDNANAYLGVGDSATAEDATQTGLLAATNFLYKAMEAGFPTYGTAQKATWKSSFGSAEANFAWNEFTVCNTGANTGKNLNRKVSAQGTKVSGQTWELNLEISLS